MGGIGQNTGKNKESRALTSCQAQREKYVKTLKKTKMNKGHIQPVISRERNKSGPRMLKETEQARGTHTLSYAEEEQVRIPNNTKQARDTHSLSSPGKGKSRHQKESSK
jgi:hypothetical protein